MIPYTSAGVFDPIARASPGSVASLAALVERARDLETHGAPPLVRAAVGGFEADRVAYAFGAGYLAALARLVPSAAPGQLRALCASEDRGAHPAAIATTLTRGEDGALRLRGAKRWATFGPDAAELLVAATTGRDDAGRNRLKLVRVDARRAGVLVRPMPPTPFTPELPHAEIALEDVRVEDDEVLDGDGYTRYVKPFRTIEDAHVLTAFAAHVAGLARAQGWPPEALEEALAAVGALASVAASDPVAATTHRALGGAIRLVEALAARADGWWLGGDPEARARWQRDRAILGVAAAARARRLEVARVAS